MDEHDWSMVYDRRLGRWRYLTRAGAYGWDLARAPLWRRAWWWLVGVPAAGREP